MTHVPSLGVWLVAIFFAGMGVLALVVPGRIVAVFGTTLLTADGRNEVRAVYGGFGLAVALLLVVTAGSTGLRAGVLTAVAVALLGMAGGRVVAALVERPRRFYPCWFYCVAEAAMAGVLLAAV
jgi:hypothetical protein